MAKNTDISRPTGVVVICVLGFVMSLIMLIISILSFGMSALFGSFASSIPAGSMLSGISMLAMVMGLITLVAAVLGIAAFYLLLKMKFLGLVLATVVSIIMIAGSLFSILSSFSFLSIIMVVLWIIILAYLWMNRELFE